MNDDIFEGVADTLFIPLAARVEISKRFPEYFYDEKALGIGNTGAIQGIVKKSSEYSMVASVARYYNMDRFVSAFIEKNGTCNIVNLGAGLETMNDRVRRAGARFY